MLLAVISELVSVATSAGTESLTSLRVSIASVSVVPSVLFATAAMVMLALDSVGTSILATLASTISASLLSSTKSSSTSPSLSIDIFANALSLSLASSSASSSLSSVVMSNSSPLSFLSRYH